MSLYKPTAAIELTIPRNSATRSSQSVTIRPRVIEATWSKRGIHTPDELRVKLDFRLAGFDVRSLRNARCRFWLWDDASERFDYAKHLRFTGICDEPKRKIDASGGEVEMLFRSFLALFLNRDFPADGIPEWTAPLPEAWSKICDHVGYTDPEQGKIVSSVDAFRSAIVFSDPMLAALKPADVISARFHQISKPTPGTGASAWRTWTYLVGVLGLITRIDRNQVIVSRVLDHFGDGDGPRFELGQNVISLEEHSSLLKASRGIILQSFDPLGGRILEGVYPPPGDDRVKHPRVHTSAVGHGARRDPLNDYETYQWPATSQEALDRAARAMWEERRRQELAGVITTAEMRVDGIDVLALETGDSITVATDPRTQFDYLSLGSQAERVAYLRSRGYSAEEALVIDQNSEDAAAFLPSYHVSNLEVHYGPRAFDVRIGYHNVIAPSARNPERGDRVIGDADR